MADKRRHQSDERGKRKVEDIPDESEDFSSESEDEMEDERFETSAQIRQSGGCKYTDQQLRTLSIFRFEDAEDLGSGGMRTIVSQLHHNKNIAKLHIVAANKKDLDENENERSKAEDAEGLCEEVIAAQKDLVVLRLHGLRWGIKDAEALSQAVEANRKLEELYLFDCSVISIPSLADSIASLPSLRTLELVACAEIGRDTDTLKSLAKGIRAAKVSALSFIDCGLNTDSITALTTVIGAGGSINFLRTLRLDGNNLAVGGIRAVADLAKKATKLRILSLAECQLGPEAAAILAEGILYHPSLFTLHVDDNALGDVGVASLVKGLQKSPSLRNLFLDRVQMGDAGVAALGVAIADLPALEKLSISGNSIGDVGAESLVWALRKGGIPSLISIRHADNPSLSASYKQEIAVLLQEISERRKNNDESARIIRESFGEGNSSKQAAGSSTGSAGGNPNRAARPPTGKKGDVFLITGALVLFMMMAWETWRQFHDPALWAPHNYKAVWPVPDDD